MQTSETLSATYHVCRMRGGSQSHLIRASDNNLYVVKFQNNPQHIRILANEYLGSKLGASLGLPMPEVRVIEVSDWLITNTPDLRVQSAGITVPCSPGLQFGSRYITNPLQDYVFDYLPEGMLKKLSNKGDFARVLAFDRWAGNSDGRQALFIKSPTDRSYRAAFIDQGYYFNAGEWSFPDLPLHGIYYKKSVYEDVTGWQSFEPVLSRIEGVRFDQLQKIANEIPAEWYEHDTAGLLNLIETLHKRRMLVRELITNFRTSSQNPFPNWTDR